MRIECGPGGSETLLVWYLLKMMNSLNYFSFCFVFSSIYADLTPSGSESNWALIQTRNTGSWLVLIWGHPHCMFSVCLISGKSKSRVASADRVRSQELVAWWWCIIYSSQTEWNKKLTGKIFLSEHRKLSSWWLSKRNFNSYYRRICFGVKEIMQIYTYVIDIINCQ
jgi:hypothetical protein